MWDKETLVSNEFLGGVRLSCGKGILLQHPELDMRIFPKYLSPKDFTQPPKSVLSWDFFFFFLHKSSYTFSLRSNTCVLQICNWLLSEMLIVEHCFGV